MYIKEMNGHQFQIADYAGEKETIIAIHGLTGTHKNMHYYAEALKGEHRFVAVDLRGRGNSSGLSNEPSIFNHATDIIDLIKELEIENPILMGHSMGAFISAIVANKLASVKGLILLDGAAEMSSHQRDIVKPSLGRLTERFDSKDAYVDKIKNLYERLGVSWTPELQSIVEYEIHQVANHWEHKSAGEKILEDFESFYLFDPREVMSEIDCQALLVYARGDIGPFPPLFFESDYGLTKKHTTNLTSVISNCNHYTMVFEKREGIIRVIKDFLEGVG